jgi:hypothetical protein
MDPLSGALLFGGGSLLKHFFFDKPKADRQRTAEAEKERYSPWTGHQEQAVDDPNPGNALLQGGTTGALLGANVQQAQAQSKLMDRLGNVFPASTNPVPPPGQMLVRPNYVPQMGSSPYRLGGDYDLYKP